MWDGNEVWLITAGGATFAAFPEWYASMFSGFYLALVLVLICLIVRGVAFEYRGKGHTDVWRARWDWSILFTSWGARGAVRASRSATSCAACRSTPITSSSAASSTC